ncbi:hypothetical protein ONZ45_g4302 [Pleurotus djamor]|nr:hypothetical protein ONZ45_g4302 [Pleurotus djamor]
MFNASPHLRIRRRYGISPPRNRIDPLSVLAIFFLRKAFVKDGVGCLPDLEAHPFLLREEETFEPPEDPDSGLSLEELGMRALARLPRDRAIEGIHAFNEMRDGLMGYLRPFAQAGKVVNETDVRDFFDQLKESAKGKGV